MAGTKIRGITIELSADASGVNSALKSANKSISSTSKELKDIDKLLKLDPTNVTLLAQKHEALQRQITNTKSKLDALKDAEEDLKKQMVDGGTEEQQRQLAALQREIISTEKNLDKYADQMNQAERETDQLAQSQREATGTSQELSGGFSVLKGALANLVADGIRVASDALKDLMTEGPAYADDILTMASTTSLATDTLQELSYMSGLVDVDVNTVAGSMKKLTKNMSSAKGGTGTAAEAFARLGVSVTDMNGNLRDNEDVFYDTIEALGYKPSGLAQALATNRSTNIGVIIPSANYVYLANMLSGMRGKGGGYVLTRPPEQYTVGEILRLTEGSLAPVACLDGDCKGCSRSDECPTLDVWKNLDKLINDYLDGVTLDALVAPNGGYDYVI